MNHQYQVLKSIRKDAAPVGAPHGKGRKPPRLSKRELLEAFEDELYQEMDEPRPKKTVQDFGGLNND